ncbi:HlyIII-domain-containing protein [Panus rudis PR-1116 ss-1]|nr:HlyIII-domain-containing protein [Panus rudis PR-1116 ss-1]
MGALDFSPASALPVLAALRQEVLTYLADLETRLAQLESHLTVSAESVKLKGEHKVEEARAWAETGLEMLRQIREDVCSHLPEVNLDSVPSVGQFVKSHMPDKHTFDEMRAHASAVPVPEAVRARLNDLSAMRSRLEDLRSRISDLDFHRPLDYIPTLSEHLQTLHAHLTSASGKLPHNLSDSLTMAYDLIDKVLTSEFLEEVSAEIREGEDLLEKAAVEISRAVQASLNGSRLIHYMDLPDKWKNNPFVLRGYRFIPLQEWPRLLLSIFALHNETLNIHTHLIPFIWWLSTLFPSIPFLSSALSPRELELPLVAYMSFALLTLFASTVWHTMSGCAHLKGMELCARADYISIGWLISATTGTVVHYGFECQPHLRKAYLVLCAIFCVSATIMPFTAWFNKREYKPYRNAFFISIFVFSWAPLFHLSFLHSVGQMWTFFRPVRHSLYWYFLGFAIYASHFPERFFSRPGTHQAHWLDWLGGGSHALWHVCVVLAIAFHRMAMQELKKGIVPGQVCEF